MWVFTVGFSLSFFAVGLCCGFFAIGFSLRLYSMWVFTGADAVCACACVFALGGRCGCSLWVFATFIHVRVFVVGVCSWIFAGFLVALGFSLWLTSMLVFIGFFAVGVCVCTLGVRCSLWVCVIFMVCSLMLFAVSNVVRGLLGVGAWGLGFEMKSLSDRGCLLRVSRCG